MQNRINIQSEKQTIDQVFNQISPYYDVLNHVLSFNIDKYWRRQMVRQLQNKSKITLLDVACGTGDSSFEAVAQGVSHVVGLDISQGMLEKARQKSQHKGLDNYVEFNEGDSAEIPFSTETFEAVTVAFGVRNFENLKLGLNEIYRVLKKGGQCVILEFSMPKKTIFASIYRFYFMKILPGIGHFISGHQKAYLYLPQSVAEFPSQEIFKNMLAEVGFQKITRQSLTGGVAQIYNCIKS